jgi:hypothetical protein
MQIYSAKTKLTEKWVEVSVGYGAKAFKVSVRTKNGIVQGNAKSGVATSYLSYFHDTPERVRQKHFEQIKAYVEKHIK